MLIILWNCLNPLKLAAAKSSLTILLKYFRRKHIYTLKEKFYSGYYQQFSFEYFVKSSFLNWLSEVQTQRAIFNPCNPKATLVQGTRMQRLFENHLNPNTKCQYKMMHKTWKMTETLVHGYSSESTQRELFNEYQHDRV